MLRPPECKVRARAFSQGARAWQHSTRLWAAQVAGCLGTDACPQLRPQVLRWVIHRALPGGGMGGHFPPGGGAPNEGGGYGAPFGGAPNPNPAGGAPAYDGGPYGGAPPLAPSQGVPPGQQLSAAINFG